MNEFLNVKFSHIYVSDQTKNELKKKLELLLICKHNISNTFVYTGSGKRSRNIFLKSLSLFHNSLWVENKTSQTFPENNMKLILHFRF